MSCMGLSCSTVSSRYSAGTCKLKMRVSATVTLSPSLSHHDALTLYIMPSWTMQETTVALSTIPTYGVRTCHGDGTCARSTARTMSHFPVIPWPDLRSIQVTSFAHYVGVLNLLR